MSTIFCGLFIVQNKFSKLTPVLAEVHRSSQTTMISSSRLRVYFCLIASLASPHVCRKVKAYYTSHHYKLIPQPREGLHNGQCTVGVTQAFLSTSGPGLPVRNEFTLQNPSIRPGPKEMCSPCLVWQPPSTASQEHKLISAALSLILLNPSHKTYYVAFIWCAMRALMAYFQ